MHTAFPGYIQFFPTLKCNRQCGFCFNRGLSVKQEIAVAEYARLAAALSEIGVREIDILGGEPTLHPSLREIMDITFARGFSINISSNGSNISLLEEMSRAYAEKPLHIGISINSDAIPPELHEYINARKPFVKSLCTQSGAPPAAVRPYLGVRDIRCFLLYRDAVSESDLGHCQPFPEYYDKLKRYMFAHGNVEGVYCQGFLPEGENAALLQRVRCPAGTTKLSILPDGSVYPCYLFFRYREFRLGNILEDSFRDIWENPILDFFRKFERNTCPKAECSLFDRCHGGCPAVSLLVSGDINAPDPRCAERAS